MKKIIIYGFMSLMIMAACRKSDNERIPELTKVPLPQLTKVSGNPTISVQEADAFSAKFSLGLFYPDGDKPAKFDVVIRKNGDNTKTKLYKSDVTTYPTELSITGVQLKEFFDNKTIELGDRFEIGVDVTLSDGRKFLAFPTVGVPYGTGSASVAGSTPTIRYEAVCSFKMSDYGAIGTSVPYTVVQDEWADYTPGATIPVTIIDETHLSFNYGTDINPKPIIITIDPVSNATSVAKQEFGGYSSLPASYGIFSTVSEPSSDNAVLPCQLKVSVKLGFSSPAGSFQGGVITLQKK